MKVALIQTSLFWENPEENRAHFESIIDSIVESVDLIVLPEMFTTGFTMNPTNIAESMEGNTVIWLKSISVRATILLLNVSIIQNEKPFKVTVEWSPRNSENYGWTMNYVKK